MPAYGFGPASGGSSSTTGTALPQYRAALANELLTKYDGNLTVSALGSGPDAARYIIINELRDDEAMRDFWAGGYLYAHTAPTGVQMKILGQGAHNQFGALAVANPPSPAIPVGTRIQLSQPLPIKRHVGIKGIDDYVNEALAISRVLARISLTGDGTRDQSLAGYPFIRSEVDIRAIYDTRDVGASEPVELSSSGFRLDASGAAMTLVTEATYDASETFQMEVFVRGDYLVFDGSGWLYPTTPGLLDEDYRAAVEEHWVVAFGMVKGLTQLRKLVMADPKIDRAEKNEQIGDLTGRLRSWRARANRIVANEFPKPIARRRPSLVSLTPATARFQ